MQAIILAAGMGKRLGKLTQDNTKCMVAVNGIRLIDRMLLQLASLKINKVIIVIGHKGENVKKHIGNQYNDVPIEYIENDIYDRTNNIYSLWLAGEYLENDDTILLESDLIFEVDILEKLIADPYANLAAVASYQSWMDGTVVTIDENRHIINMLSKKTFQFSEIGNYYKTVNIYKFSKEFSKTHFVPFLAAYTKALGKNEYYEQVLRIIALLDKPDIKVLPIEQEKWYEIDDIQDLDIAETLFADSSQQLSLYNKRYGGYWRFPGLVDFCYLVNPFFPPQKMKEELCVNFEKLLCEYPSGMGVNRLLAGRYFNVSPAQILVGNGAAELINALCSILNKETGKVGLIFPAFEEYVNRLTAANLEIFQVNSDDLHYTVSDIENYFEDKSIRNLLLINPDNPSGNCIPYEDLLKLIQWAKERFIRIIIDESFIDFSENGLASTLLNDDMLSCNSHLIVIKSISKSYGVPGLRLGVLATGDSKILDKIKEYISIWNINSFAEFYMQIFSKYETEYINACDSFIQERKRFKDALEKISFLKVLPSQANYFLCKVLRKFSSRELAEKLLIESNILIKDCSGKKGFNGKNYIRIAIKGQRDNDQLIQALQLI